MNEFKPWYDGMSVGATETLAPSETWLTQQVRALERMAADPGTSPHDLDAIAGMVAAFRELAERCAQRCETCGEWMTVSGPDECPWMFGPCPENGYCFHWQPREEPADD